MKIEIEAFSKVISVKLNRSQKYIDVLINQKVICVLKTGEIAELPAELPETRYGILQNSKGLKTIIDDKIIFGRDEIYSMIYQEFDDIGLVVTSFEPAQDGYEVEYCQKEQAQPEKQTQDESEYFDMKNILSMIDKIFLDDDNPQEFFKQLDEWRKS